MKIEVEGTPIILSDSTSAAAITANPVYHSKTKRFEIDLHLIKDKVTKGELEIGFVASKDQIADVLTKPLPYYKFSQFRSKLRVFDKPLSLREGVENSSCEKSTADPQAMLACHLSHCQLEPTDLDSELDLMSCQNSYTEESQHLCMKDWNF